MRHAQRHSGRVAAPADTSQRGARSSSQRGARRHLAPAAGAHLLHSTATTSARHSTATAAALELLAAGVSTGRRLPLRPPSAPVAAGAGVSRAPQPQRGAVGAIGARYSTTYANLWARLSRATAGRCGRCGGALCCGITLRRALDHDQLDTYVMLIMGRLIMDELIMDELILTGGRNVISATPRNLHNAMATSVYPKICITRCATPFYPKIWAHVGTPDSAASTPPRQTADTWLCESSAKTVDIAV